MEKEDLKVFELFIDEESGDDLYAISLVENPAIEQMSMFFNSVSATKEKQEFKFSSDEKMEITGPIMVANKKILRQNEKTGEYFYVFFSPETVKKSAQMFFKNQYTRNINKDHKDYVNCYILESWFISDSDKDKSNVLGFSDINIGDWYGTIKTEDPALWQQLKENYSNGIGFSVEGMFSFLPVFLESVELNEERLIDILDNDKLTDEFKLERIKIIIEKSSTK